MVTPVILVFADDDDVCEALVNEIIEKLNLAHRIGNPSDPRVYATSDSFASLRLSSLASYLL